MSLRTIVALSLAVLGTGGLALAESPTPGCDQERWDNWAEIMEEARGWPEEQAEIRKAADYNRKVCDDVAAGVLTVEEADRLQSESTDALWRSMQRKKARRQESAGTKEAG